MSEQKITLELTEAEAREIAGPAYCPGWLKERAQAALPPEWAEGNVAFVTQEGVGNRWIAVRRDGQWRANLTAGPTSYVSRVTKVEPIRTLADDEIAVKRGWASPRDFRNDAARLDKVHGHSECSVSLLLRRIADALDKAGEPNA